MLLAKLLTWCGEKHGDLDKRYQLEDIAASSLWVARKVLNHHRVFLLNERWYGAGREGIACARSCWGTWKVDAALWCSCLAGAAWLFFPSAWRDRHPPQLAGEDWLISCLCICSWFTHHFVSPSLPTCCCSLSDPERMALKQLIKACSLNQSQHWLHLY